MRAHKKTTKHRKSIVVPSVAANLAAATLDTLLSAAPAGIAVFDRELRYVRVNAALAAMNGVPAAEHLGRTVREVLPLVAPTLEPLLQHVLHAGEPLLDVTVSGEAPVAVGQIRHALASYYPVQDEDGHVVAVCAVLQDITERAATAAALEKSETRYQDLFEHASDIVYVLDMSGRLLALNAAGERLTGYRRDELLGQPIAQLVVPGYLPVMAEMRDRKVDGTPITSYELEILAKDGRRLVLEVNSRLVYQQGQPVEIHGIARDITERKRSEEARRFLSDAVHALATSLDYETTLARVAALAVPRIADYALVDVVEQDGRIRRAAAVHRDPQASAVLDRLAREYPPIMDARYGVPRVFQEGQPVLSATVSADQLQRVARDPDHLALLLTLNPRSAMLVPIHIDERVGGVLTLTMTTSGRVYGPADLALAEDLAERVAQAIINARLYQQAQAAVRARDQFFSVAAHELRTPLTSLSGYAQLLKRRAEQDGSLPPRDLRAIQAIHHQTDRLQALTAELLDYSRIETGQLQVGREPVDLVALARRAAEDARLTVEHGAVPHTLEFESAEPPLMVIGDGLRIEQVIQNLLQNAVKYSPGGGRIGLAVGRRDDRAFFAVSDQGLGIPAAALPRLFERFYRADNIDPRQISGLGIGLYVVNEIVEQHGGMVQVESVEGQGSTFTVWLPLA